MNIKKRTNQKHWFNLHQIGIFSVFRDYFELLLDFVKKTAVFLK